MAVEREYWKKVAGLQRVEDYPEVEDADIKFPDRVGVAYAVCTPDCGRAEFIVDGSTQICSYCGRTMFRTVVRWYTLSPDMATGEGPPVAT